MFQKAEKKKSYLRLALVGPSGSGKTYTALEIATGLAEKTGSRIAVIDTEHGSAQLYADLFDFDFAEIEAPYSVKDYVKVINEAQKQGIQILVIDSSTHGWQYILDFVETLTQTKYKGNSFRAWSEGTPLYNEWVDAMLSFKGHIIVTMRAKTEYAIETVNGKTTPQKIGMGAENRKGIEYEFTMLMEGTVDHYFTVTKDRTSKFQDQIIKLPSRELGYDLYEWLNQGGEFIEYKPVSRQTILDPGPRQQPVQNQPQQKTTQNKGANMQTVFINAFNLITDGVKSGWIHKTEEEALRLQLNTSQSTNNLVELQKLNDLLMSRKKNFKPAQQTPVDKNSPSYWHKKIEEGIKTISEYDPYNNQETVDNFLISHLGVSEIKKSDNLQLLEGCYNTLVTEYKRVKQRSA